MVISSRCENIMLDLGHYRSRCCSIYGHVPIIRGSRIACARIGIRWISGEAKLAECTVSTCIPVPGPILEDDVVEEIWVAIRLQISWDAARTRHSLSQDGAVGK